MRDHPEIAVRRFAGVDEKGRCSRRGKRRGNLLGDVAALADASHDDAAADGLEPAASSECRGHGTGNFVGKLRKAFGSKIERPER